MRGLILRRREDDERVDLTLKARSEDWCLAAAAEVRADKDLPEKRVKQKFEEDIAAPFRPRFSNSCTVKFSAGNAPPASASLADAAAWFPGLGKLNRDGLRCAAETPLAVVHGVEVYERVWEGPEWKLSGDVEATVAVILWSAGPDGRNLAGELSFRLGDGQKPLDIHPAAG